MALPAVEGYSELEEIGAGGFATVYRARQVRLDRQVALKVLRAKDLDEATVRLRVGAETRDVPRADVAALELGP